MRTSWKNMLWILWLVCALVTTQADAAGPPEPPRPPIGPFLDLVGLFERTIPQDIVTPGGCAPLSLGLGICWSDVAHIEITVRIAIVVDTYVSFCPGCPNPLQLVDVWAKDLNPPGMFPLRQTGFDPFNPEMIPVGPENFIGRSGTFYPAPLVATTLASLPSVLPGFDLSPFQGDPSSIFYVAQASVPEFDFFVAVPAPGTLALLGTGTLAILTLRWRPRGRRFASTRARQTGQDD